MSLKSFRKQSVKSKSFAAGLAGGIGGGSITPVISSIIVTDSSYNNLDDTALNPAGGYAKIIGTNFESGCIVYFNGSTLTTTYISDTEVRVVTPAITAGSYSVMLFNLSSNAGAIFLNLNVSNFPTFTTGGGLLSTVYETQSINSSISATGDAPITYSKYSGNLPPGITLSSTGVLSGVSQATASTQNYEFVVQAKDAQNQDSYRTFSLTINTDSVAWATPVDNSTVTAYEYDNINIPLSASSGAGYSVNYSSVTLPSGLSISGNSIIGAPIVPATTVTTVTATAATTNRSSNRTINFTINQDAVTWSNPVDNTTITSYEYVALSPTALSASALAAGPITYSIVSSAAAELNITGNSLQGTKNATGSYAAVLKANATNTNRSSNINVTWQVLPDQITWSNPPQNQAYGLDVSSPMDAVNLSASSAAGFGIVYTSDVLPTGLSISGNQIVGTPTVGGETITTTLTATSNTSNRTATRSISWSILLGNDTLFKNVSLLLSANASTQTASFAKDNSANSSQLSTFGDVRASNLNPYQQNYYSVEYTGTVNDYVSIPHNSNLSIMSGSTNTFVAECFIYFNTVGANCTIMDKSGRNGVSFQNWSIELNASKQFRLVWGASGSPGSSGIGILDTTTVPVVGKWYHIAFVKSNADWALFVDGVRLTSFNGLNTANDANPTALRIGMGITGESNASYINGLISNVRVYNGSAGSAPYSATSTSITVPTTPFTAGSNVYALVNQSPRHVDNSSTSATLTVGSSVKISAAVPYQNNATYATYGSAYFDGIGDWLLGPTISALTLTADFTIEAWINPSNVSGTKGIMGIFGSGGGWYLGLNGAALRFSNGLAGGDFDAGIITANSWTHVAVTRSGNSMRMYINGTQVNTTTDVSALNFNVSNPIYIGQINTAGWTYTGYIADVRVIKGTALYTGTTLTIPTTPLTAISNTQLLTCQTNGLHNTSTFKDKSNFNNLITKNGNASNSSFSPYGDNWSIYFDGTSTSNGFALPTTVTLGAGNFTLEFWYQNSSWNGGPGSITLAPIFNNFSWYTGTTSGGVVCYAGPGYFTFDLYTKATNASSGATKFSVTTSAISHDVWNHIAVVRNSGNLLLFVNGVLKQTTAITSDIRINYDGTYGYNIGKWYGFNATTAPTAERYFKGHLSNLRLSTTALYTSPFTPSTQPLKSLPSTQVLLFASNRFENLAETAVVPTYTNTGTISIQKNSPFSTAMMPRSYSTKFNGTSDYLTVASNSAFALGTGDFTVECWLNVLGAGDNRYCFPVQSRDGTNVGFYLQYDRTNQNLTFASDSGTPFALSTATSSIADYTWYHICAVRSAGTISLYLNGTFITSVNSSENLTSTGPLYVSRRYASDGAFHYFNGFISDLRIIKGSAVIPPAGGPTSTLTAVTNTVLLTCNSNTLKDGSSNNFAITSGTTTVKPALSYQFSPSMPAISYDVNTFGGSIYFDGTGDYLQTATGLAHTDITQSDYTVECWVYNQGAGAERYIFSQRGSSSGWEMRINAANTVSFFFTGGTTFTSTTTVRPLEWTHIAVVRSGTALSMYINGVKDTTGSGTQTNGTSTYASYGLWLGNSTSGGGLMLGYISDARVLKGVALYSGNFYPGTTPLTPHVSVGTSTYNSSVLLSANGGVADAGRSTSIETVDNVKSVNYGPYATNSISYVFDGNGDYMSASTGSGIINFGTGDFTIETWVNFSGNNGTYNPFVRGNGGTLDFGYDFSTSQLKYNTSVGVLANSWTPTIGTWYHLALVRSAGNAKIYVNATNVSGAGVADSYNHALMAPATYFRIGGSDYSAAHVLKGYLSDLRITKGVARTITVPTAPLPTK